MNAELLLSSMSEEDLRDLLVEVFNQLEVPTIYGALRRGLTGAEMDRLAIYLSNSHDFDED